MRLIVLALLIAGPDSSGLDRPWEYPGLEDCAGFPSKEELTRKRLLNHEYQEEMQFILDRFPNNANATGAQKDAAKSDLLLSILEFAVDETEESSWRRANLALYRSQVGRERYYSFWVPQPIPLSRLPYWHKGY